MDLNQSHAKIAACASCCKCLLSSDGKEGLVEMSIYDLPSTFLLMDNQKQRLRSLPHDIVINHVQVLQYKDRFYHLIPDLVFNLEKLCSAPSVQGIQWQKTKRVLLQAMTMVGLDI
jgi:hypothetical protein